MPANMDGDYKVLVVRQNWTERHVARYVSRLLSRSLASDRTFTLLNVEDVINKVTNWKEELPRITPFYAVRCNNNLVVLEILAALGVCFSCSSMQEIDLILKTGVDPDRIIFGHTAKPRTHLLHARQHGVDLLSFDADVELLKIKQFHPNAKLLIRIRCGGSATKASPSEKFGCCSRTEAPELLRIAKELSLQVVGVSFHVPGDRMYRRGIQLSAQLFDIGFSLGFHMQILDIGGGLPGDMGTSISPVAREINSALNEYFPPDNEVEIIAQPGRYFVESAVTIVSNVHSARRPLSMLQEEDDQETSPGIQALLGTRASGSNVSGAGLQGRREIGEGLSSIREHAITSREVRQNLQSLGEALLQELKCSTLLKTGALKISPKLLRNKDAHSLRGNGHISRGNAEVLTEVIPSKREGATAEAEIVPSNITADTEVVPSNITADTEVIPPKRENIQQVAEVIPSKREDTGASSSAEGGLDKKQTADIVEGLIASVENIDIRQEIAEENADSHNNSGANDTVIRSGGEVDICESPSNSERVKKTLFSEGTGASSKAKQKIGNGTVKREKKLNIDQKIPRNQKSDSKTEGHQSEHDTSDDLDMILGNQMEAEKMHYYMDNGIYGSFSAISSHRMIVNPEPLEDLPGSYEPCVLWGPTSDGRDVVSREAWLPPLPLPSWLLFRSKGAYTSATATSFCGLGKPADHAFATQSTWDILHQLPKIRERRRLQPTYAPLELPPPFSIFKPTLSSVHAKHLIPTFTNQPAPNPLHSSPMFQKVSPTSTVETPTHEQITMRNLSDALRSCLSPFSISPSSVESPNSILKPFPNHKIKMNSELLKKNVRFVQSPDCISSNPESGPSDNPSHSNIRMLNTPLHHNILNTFDNPLHANMSGYNPPFPDMSAFLTPSCSSNTPSTSNMPDFYSSLSNSPPYSPYTPPQSTAQLEMDLRDFITPPSELVADSTDPNPMVVRIQPVPTSPVRTMRIARNQDDPNNPDDSDKSPTNPTFSPTRGRFSRT